MRQFTTQGRNVYSHHLSITLELKRRNNQNISKRGEDKVMAPMQRLSNEIEKNRPHLTKKKVLFNQDNVLVHTSVLFARFNPLELFSFPI